MNEEAWEARLKQWPVVTYALCAGCVLMFLWQLNEGRGSGVSASAGQVTAYPGYVGGLDFAMGKYWGLLTSFFLHGSVPHVAFNVYWVYQFGTKLEVWMGWWRFLLFWFVATCISGITEYCFAGTLGVGASGFAYALFGLIWIGGRAEPYLRHLLDHQTALIFVGWLFACLVLTWTNIMPIANGAHFGGFLYGALCAFAFVLRNDVRLKAAVCVLTLVLFIPAFYAPWLAEWNLAQAQEAVAVGDYARALPYLDRADVPDYRAYVMSNKAECYEHLGQTKDAAALYKSLLEQPDADTAYLANAYAWMLATSPDATIRNPDEAIRYAKKTCETSDYKEPNSLDTLAAASASAGQFDEAVKWEEKAIAGNTDSKLVEELNARLRLFQAKKPYIETKSPESH